MGRENRGVVCQPVFPVLWLPEPAAEYDAGLREDLHLPESYTGQSHRFCWQGCDGRWCWFWHSLFLRPAGRRQEGLRRGGLKHRRARDQAGGRQQGDEVIKVISGKIEEISVP